LKLSLVLAESALELVPEEVASSPDVASDSRRRGKKAREILLDRSFHQGAMATLEEGMKRGRPDLVHVALLSVTSTPLYLEGLVDVYVHTSRDIVIRLKPKTRLTKSYVRFRGLAEQVLAERPNGGLLSVSQGSLRGLLRSVRPDWVCGLSTQGKQSSFERVGMDLSGRKNPCVVVGGFPQGHFAQDTLKAFDALLRVHPMPLDAHVVVSRVIYEVEKHLND
jgi:rRNA small subunit pseudouridine methyltransferase Nep1